MSLNIVATIIDRASTSLLVADVAGLLVVEDYITREPATLTAEEAMRADVAIRHERAVRAAPRRPA